MKKIVLFNHKGGVSKTTTTFNLGWKFAEKGRKVLLVDGDPQCNLTSLFLGETFDEYYEDQETKFENIKDGVKAAFEGKPEPIKVLTCKTAERNGNLYLLAGHMNFSEYDAQLNFAQNASNALSSLKSLPGANDNDKEKYLTQKLELLVGRRDQIAHESDMSYTGKREITQMEVEDAITFIDSFVACEDRYV